MQSMQKVTLGPDLTFKQVIFDGFALETFKAKTIQFQCLRETPKRGNLMTFIY